MIWRTLMNAFALLFLLVGLGACKRAVAPVTATPVDPPPAIRFVAYDGDPTKTASKDMSFLLSWLDSKKPSEFLKLGDRIADTPFRLSKFEYKMRHDSQTGVDEDASELTLVNSTGSQAVILTIPKPVNAPPVF